MSEKPKYSIIVPVFNSEPSLGELYDGIREVFQKINSTFEVIFVDDRSKDGSWEVLKGLKKSDPDHVRAIKLSKNFGQHNATMCGFGFAQGEFLITIDDDLQIPPAEILKLIDSEKETDADLVYGIFKSKSHSKVRNAGSQSLKRSSKALHNAPGEGSSFRLIKKELVEKLLVYPHHFIYIDEILHWYTDEIVFAEVVHLPRKYKQSGYSMRKLVHLFANILMYYTVMPLKFLVWGGFTVSIISFVYGVFHIVKKFIYDVPLGYTSLIVVILFSTSIILFSLGIIGEYLRRIYQIQNRKPPWSIQKIL